ncbi:hypothetical protein Q8A73_016872 [Channa argus]|nr:hypothetical protein Q8A73_016872 [Channa argus]
MGAAWELERLASREGGSAKVVSGATRDFGPTRRQERPYSGFAFWQSPVSLSNVKAAVSVERSACAKRARPWVGAQQRPVLRPVNNTAPRHLRSVRGEQGGEKGACSVHSTHRPGLAVPLGTVQPSLHLWTKKKNLLSFSGREPNGTAAGGHAKYPCRLSGGFSGRGGLREMGAAWELERLASREGGSAKVVSGATRDFGPTRRQERPYSGFAFWQSPVSLSNVKAAVSVERSACAKRARPWVGAQQRPVLRPVNNTAPRHLRSVRGGWLRQQRVGNREMKKGLAPFTLRIDLALQCRWERLRGQRFHPATGPFYRSPRCPSPFLAPRSRSASS